MDVRCDRCDARYAFNEALFGDADTSIRCTRCEHVIRVSSPRRPPAPEVAPSAFSAPLFSETSPSIRLPAPPPAKSFQTLGALYDAPADAPPGVASAGDPQSATMRFPALSPPNDTVVSAPALVAPVKSASAKPPSDARTLLAHPAVAPAKPPPSKRFEDTIPVENPHEFVRPKRRMKKGASLLRKLYRSAVLLILVLLAAGVVGWFLFPEELLTFLGL